MVWFRLFAGLVGVAVLAVYTAVSLVGLLVLRWLATNPPGLVPAALAFGAGVLVAAYVGYRVGTVRLVASLRAQELPRQYAPVLSRRVDRLVAEMRVDRPPLLVADLGAPNALSVGGPRRGAVVLDRSLLDLLTVDELEGIVAHELAHMERYDTFVNTLALTLARTVTVVGLLVLLPVVVFLMGVDRAVGWFAGRPGVRPGLAGAFQWGVMLVLGVVFAVFALAYLAYSRRQEYAADSRAADLTGRPEALARALAKIHRANEPRGGLHSMLYIHEQPNDRIDLLSTHPPVGRRVERLLERAGDTRHHHVQRLA